MKPIMGVCVSNECIGLAVSGPGCRWQDASPRHLEGFTATAGHLARVHWSMGAAHQLAVIALERGVGAVWLEEPAAEAGSCAHAEISAVLVAELARLKVATRVIPAGAAAGMRGLALDSRAALGRCPAEVRALAVLGLALAGDGAGCSERGGEARA